LSRMTDSLEQWILKFESSALFLNKAQITTIPIVISNFIMTNLN
jgi:hypothetical protein